MFGLFRDKSAKELDDRNPKFSSGFHLYYSAFSQPPKLKNTSDYAVKIKGELNRLYSDVINYQGDKDLKWLFNNTIDIEVKLLQQTSSNFDVKNYDDNEIFGKAAMIPCFARIVFAYGPAFAIKYQTSVEAISRQMILNVYNNFRQYPKKSFEYGLASACRDIMMFALVEEI